MQVVQSRLNSYRARKKKKKKNDRKQWSDDLDYLFRLLCLQK